MKDDIPWQQAWTFPANCVTEFDDTLHKKSTRRHWQFGSWVDSRTLRSSQRTVSMTFPAAGVILNLFISCAIENVSSVMTHDWIPTDNGNNLRHRLSLSNIPLKMRHGRPTCKSFCCLKNYFDTQRAPILQMLRLSMLCSIEFATSSIVIRLFTGIISSTHWRLKSVTISTGQPDRFSSTIPALNYTLPFAIKCSHHTTEVPCEFPSP